MDNNHLNNNIANNHMNNYFLQYLNSVSESRRVLNVMVDTLNTQEHNIYTMYNAVSRNAHQYRTSPISRWWRNQPNYPSRINRFNYDALRGLFNVNNLEPVVVRPTREQILNSTSVISVRDIPLSNRFYNVCPISYETFTDDTVVTRINNCGHYFDTNSINEWFNRNVRCPVCRYDIRNDISRVNNQDVSGNYTFAPSTSTPSTRTPSTSTPTTSTPTTSTPSTRTTTNPVPSIRHNISTNHPHATSTSMSNNGVSDINVIDTLFSNLQQYMSTNPSFLQVEYSFVPLDSSNNIADTESEPE
jgi:hypothetical protein